MKILTWKWFWCCQHKVVIVQIWLLMSFQLVNIFFWIRPAEGWVGGGWVHSSSKPKPLGMQYISCDTTSPFSLRCVYLRFQLFLHSARILKFQRGKLAMVRSCSQQLCSGTQPGSTSKPSRFPCTIENVKSKHVSEPSKLPAISTKRTNTPWIPEPFAYLKTKCTHVILRDDYSTVSILMNWRFALPQ